MPDSDTLAPTRPRLQGPTSRRPRRGTADANAEGRSERVSNRTRITLSLSEHSMHAFDELKRLTDADTDSEVFRNALRLHLSLLRSHIRGDTLLLRRADTDQAEAISLFAKDGLLVEQEKAQAPRVIAPKGPALS